MSGCGIKLIQRKERLSQLIERLGLSLEIVDVKDGFGVWKVILLQVVVQACAGGSEVGDACADADAGACEDDDALELVFF